MSSHGEPIYTWHDADGVATELREGASGIQLLLGALGLDAPPTELTLGALLSSDGSALVSRRHPHRPIVLPLYMEDATRVGNLVAQAARMFRGPGVLQRDDGTTVRELTNVIYEAGLAGNDAISVAGEDVWRKVVVSLLALDPWWYGDSTVLSLSSATTVAFDDAGTVFDAGIGFDGSTPNPVTNSGDADASPVTTIQGPFTTLQVGQAGGETFTLAGPLASTDTIVVDTRTGTRGPRLNSGPVDWSLLTPASRLWTVPQGASTLNASSTGSTGGSLIEVSFRERFLTP